jgi:hypothetical protein
MKNVKKVPIRYPKRGKDGQWLKITRFWLEERVAFDLERARNECLRRYGDHLLVTSMGRDHDEQEYLYRTKGPKIAAKPGRSWHEAGCAIDVDMAHLNKLTGSQQASEAFLAEFGFVRSCWETWHFENHRYWPRSKGVAGAIAYIGNAA